MKIYTSQVFDDALETELRRLLKERYEVWAESAEGIEVIDKSVQVELDKVTPLIRLEEETKKLVIWLSPPESDASKDIDFEQLINESITDFEEDEQLKFIHDRLQAQVKKVREAIKKRKTP